MRWFERSVLVVVLSLFCGSVVWAAVPTRLEYQGYLTDVVGTPIDCQGCATPYAFKFSLYDDAVGGEILWTETHTGIDVINGVFRVELGSDEDLDAELLDGGRWLEIEINGQGPLVPRQRVVSAPYALRADLAERALESENAVTLGGQPVESFVQVTDTSDFISLAELGDILADLGYTPGDNDSLAALSCGLDEIVKWNGSAWVCAVNADTDTLSNLLCAAGEIAQWDGPSWECSAALDVLLASLDPIATTGLPADLADGDDDTLAALVCSDGQVAMLVVDTWSCVDAPPGPQGEPGEAGADGAPGDTGAAGAVSLISNTTEPEGANCEYGGVKVEHGVDDNGNDALDVDEIQGTSYVCNGGLASDGIIELPVAAEPVEQCTDAIEGQLFYDTTLKSMRYCDGVYWAPTASGCGNGQLDSGEECDDGYQVDGDGCQANCLIAENDICTGTCDGNGTMQAYLPNKITASDGAVSDHFGYSVSISGDTLVVGSRYDDDNGGNSGSAYVYVRSGGVWTVQQKLVASDGASGDYFGWSVAISGDTLVVGAKYDDDNGNDSGSAYVYLRSGGVWTEQQKLTASDGAAWDYFGVGVGISGDTLVVGANEDDDMGNQSGSAYVYVRSGGVWTEQQKITASDGASGEEFGYSVSISGDTLVVGAYRSDDKGPGSGSAYVYVRSGGVWTEQQKLIASDGAGSDKFGYSVSISGDTLVVGAFLDDDDGTDSGSAYVYVRSGGAWTEQQKIIASDGASGEEFGTSVAISGDTVVVGADKDDDKGPTSGSAYVYMRSGGVWAEKEKLTASDGANSDEFGTSVAISGDTVVVGANEDDDEGGDSGSAYVHELLTLCTKQGQCICKAGYGGTDCGTAL